jgi:hypothetical protein
MRITKSLLSKEKIMTKRQLAAGMCILGFATVLMGCGTGGIKSDSSHRDISSVGDQGDDFAPIDYAKLKKVDILGIPFGDTVLNEMRTDRNIGANNLVLQDDFILRFTYLAENFSGDLENMGFQSCYIPQGVDKSDYRDYQSGGRLVKGSSIVRVAKDFWSSRYCFLQAVRLPADVQWKTPRSDLEGVHMPRVISLFLPNVMTVDLDTTGTWPFGHRPTDQLASRFTTLFLKMGKNPGDCSGIRDLEEARKRGEDISTEGLTDREKCHLESLNQPSAANNRFHAWKNPGAPAFPISPPRHPFKDKDGRELEIPEDEFPFLLPPNEGRGYYQTKPGP